ncbi:hypothetical protein HZU73_03347 [Apis mellifera caucasica]|uniref:Uncharacterized protein LOC107964994 n=1 Tax=Apis mellifera TaxID=7460 RepID=A0A7M7II21_APIME|nr:uncharacterized protein LOC107964994 [Apis mellifera]KAG6801226.1 hypothetical protein HZU73_03347 [Apis mellifera caucasica]|eukprot:XP_016769573.1 uncharacterized protein LOC107964994 [Apis mellifera]
MNIVTVSLLFVFLGSKITLANRTSFYTQEVLCLSELPMSELIQIKSTLGDEEDVEEDEQPEEISSRTFSLSSLPVAQPLKRINRKPMRRYEDHYEEKGKDTKISKIFQLSVTALSFLAFGGYLLCLIITGIRQGNTGNGNVIVLSNLQGLQAYNRPKRDVPAFESLENDLEIEKLYRGMILLSKYYAMYKNV